MTANRVPFHAYLRKKRKNKAYLIAENKLLRESNERMISELVTIRRAAQIVAEQAYKIINAVSKGMEL